MDELGAFLAKHGMTSPIRPASITDDNYYAVFFTDPDGMKLEGMVYKPPPKRKTVRKKK